ncbi:MAG: ChbG/HpnK family deacetylase [Prolixibacteraceae bacterium]|nr:ChbG/HpnK family deacetylase [Prolixibacteraceae bacterium]MBT6766022.1 ChbG/HpnK family deacetylase [Prolixibacteraceae bacterium]MBT6997669.1 ChbG/HpnK family deacetylase [Prolixibacteraceae bacterium]MBT7396113.1 ChbG/HpnK family deacetylase [Prolixibacteraceae bacterium]
MISHFSIIKASNSETESNKTEQNWAEKLGYPAGSKVIILHSDDAGMCEEANIATEYYLENNFIQSAAVMVPCENAEAFVEWAKKNPTKDVGVHLTHTSEWKEYRWGTVADPAEVPGLIDPDGKMWHNVPQVVMNATAAEVEKEIRAQIEKVIAQGYRPSHIDTHMGTLYGHPSFVAAFLKVAQEYKIPANAIDLSNPEVVAVFREQGYPITDDVIELVNKYTLPKVDFFTSAPNAKSYEEKVDNFKQLINQLKPGITEIIFHPSVETENLKSITGSWQQRVWEAKIFADADLIQFFKDEGIIFTNWKEMMARFEK